MPQNKAIKLDPDEFVKCLRAFRPHREYPVPSTEGPERDEALQWNVWIRDQGHRGNLRGINRKNVMRRLRSMPCTGAVDGRAATVASFERALGLRGVPPTPPGSTSSWAKGLQKIGRKKTTTKRKELRQIRALRLHAQGLTHAEIGKKLRPEKPFSERVVGRWITGH